MLKRGYMHYITANSTYTERLLITGQAWVPAIAGSVSPGYNGYTVMHPYPEAASRQQP